MSSVCCIFQTPIPAMKLTVLLLIAVWASQAQFEKFKTEVGTKVMEPFKGDLEGPPSLNTISGGSADYAKILGAPVVHFTLIAPKEGVSPADVKPIGDEIVKIEEANKATIGYMRSQVNEKPTNILAIVGWESKEVSLASLRPWDIC